MKNYIQAQYSEIERSSQWPIDEVRVTMQVAWGSITLQHLLCLIECMP